MGDHPTTNRRRVLKGLSAATIGSVAFSNTTAARGSPKRDRGFPPSGITTWGEEAQLGEGTVRSFSSVTPSGIPKYAGLHFSEGVLPSLPTPEELETAGPGPTEGGGLVAELHGGFWSKLYSLSFPDNTPEPIEYLGFGWNSQGHLPPGVYSKPHFDIHFYFHSPDKIGSIGPRNPSPGTPDPITTEDIADGQIPDGYRLIEGGAVVPKMGAHLAPKDAPEFDDRDDASKWLKTLIWGAADISDDDVFELNFVEPMITRDFFENHLNGVHREAIAQPKDYPMDGWYPTAYSIRDLGDGGYAVVVEDFKEREV